MRTLGFFLLIGLLVLWSEILFASGIRIPREKPGLCPFIHGRCRMLNPPNDCDFDFQCRGHLKCCEGICGRQCLPPVYASHSFSRTIRCYKNNPFFTYWTC